MNCLACNKELTGKQKLYCSNKCGVRVFKRRARGVSIADAPKEAVCCVCHKPYTRTRQPHEVCSDKCRGRRYWRMSEGRPISDTPTREEACAHCGEPFTWGTHHSYQRYCSVACGQAGWANENKAARKAYRAQWWKDKQRSMA